MNSAANSFPMDSSDTSGSTASTEHRKGFPVDITHSHDLQPLPFQTTRTTLPQQIDTTLYAQSELISTPVQQPNVTRATESEVETAASLLLLLNTPILEDEYNDDESPLRRGRASSLESVFQRRRQPLRRLTNVSDNALITPDASNRALWDDSMSDDGDEQENSTTTANASKTFESDGAQFKYVSGRRAYICPFEGCNSTFPSRAHLRRHEPVHSGVKRFRCNYCTKRFTRNDNRMKHERLAHEDQQ